MIFLAQAEVLPSVVVQFGLVAIPSPTSIDGKGNVLGRVEFRVAQHLESLLITAIGQGSMIQVPDEARSIANPAVDQAEPSRGPGFEVAGGANAE